MQNVIFITDIFIFNVPAEPQINAGTITLLLKKRKGNHMNIVFMNGGLGNQTFQYIYLRYLELQTGQPCIIDDSPFWGSDVPHNGYELEKVFHIHHQRMSELFDADVWNYMVSQRNSVAGYGPGLAAPLFDLGYRDSRVRYADFVPHYDRGLCKWHWLYGSVPYCNH